MSIEVVLAGSLEKESDREGFSAFLKSLCDEQGLKLEDYDSYVLIDVCPEGAIECSYEGCYISIAAQTNVAGPGFHAFVCTLYDEILKDSGISFEVSDVTNYYFDRNFENLKYKYFYKWLKDIAGYVEDHIEAERDLCISWPMDYYHPKLKEGSVVTPMGYIKAEDFHSLDIEELAQRFFIWDTLEKSAVYYRNCALTLLWKECYYSYSSMNEYTDKVANTIIDYIEAAYEKDILLPLPVREYEELCHSIQREVLIHEATELRIADLGYRREVVKYHFGSWGIPADGCAEKSFDQTTQTMHFMAPYKNHDDPWVWLINANAYTFDAEVPAFLEKLMNPTETAIDSFSITREHLEGKGIVEAVEDYYMMSVQVNCEKDTLFLECVIKDKEDIKKIKGWMEGITHQITVNDHIKN